MLQLELYVADMAQTALLFTDIFGLSPLNQKPGFLHLRHPAPYDIMLFSPEENRDGENHWDLPRDGKGGQGIEIVLVVTGIADKQAAVRQLGYAPSKLRTTPWGSTEFTFSLPEGYLLRIKEAAAEN